MFRWKVAVILAFTLFSVACPVAVGASVLLDIQRLSDTQGILTGSGSIAAGVAQPYANANLLTLADPFGAGPSSYANDIVFGSSTLLVGTNPAVEAFDCGSALGCIAGTQTTAIYFGTNGNIATGDTFSGALYLQLAAGTTFAPVGSSGDVFWGLGAAETGPIGIWEITAAPIPAALPLFAAGLGGLGLLGWRRKRRAANQAPSLIQAI